MKIIPSLVALAVTGTLQADPSSIAFHPKVYPHGLYGDRAAANPEGLGPKDGSYEVLTHLTAVTGLQTDAVQGSATQGSYELKNLRIASAQTSFEDYLVGHYSFDFATQHLTPVKFERAPGVGIFEPENSILLKDAPGVINFYTNPATPAQFAQGTQYSFQSSTDYFTDLVVGQRLCVVLNNVPFNQTFRFVLTQQDGSVYGEESLTTPNGVVTITFNSLPVLITGKYRLRLEPLAPVAAFSYKIRFYNENSSTTVTTSSGNTLTASLGGSGGGSGLPYKKYKIALNNGQTVNLPADLDTNIYLLNSRGAIVGGGSNSGLSEAVTEAGDYYIVICPREGTASGTEVYGGDLTVTSSLGFLNWSSSHGLGFGQDGFDQDGDRDGVPNIVEYALGLNPNRSEALPTIVSLSPTQATLNFPKPDYVQGVTVQPRFSTDGVNWTNATAVASGSAPGKTLMTATVPRLTRALARLEVTPN